MFANCLNILIIKYILLDIKIGIGVEASKKTVFLD